MIKKSNFIRCIRRITRIPPKPLNFNNFRKFYFFLQTGYFISPVLCCFLFRKYLLGKIREKLEIRVFEYWRYPEGTFIEAIGSLRAKKPSSLECSFLRIAPFEVGVSRFYSFFITEPKINYVYNLRCPQGYPNLQEFDRFALLQRESCISNVMETMDHWIHIILTCEFATRD